MGTQAIMPSAQAVESALIEGDLSKLSPEQRVSYMKQVCDSMGLNPLTKPFEYVKLSGRLILYARKDATDQLRKLHNVSVTILEKARIDDVYVVTAQATTPDGRCDTDVGAVTIGDARGDVLANLLMKAITKAKRRVTLSICGLGLLDETELETVPGAQVVPSSTDNQAPRPALAAAPPVAPLATKLERELTESIEDAKKLDFLAESFMDAIRAAKTKQRLKELFVNAENEGGEALKARIRDVFNSKSAELKNANVVAMPSREPGEDDEGTPWGK